MRFVFLALLLAAGTAHADMNLAVHAGAGMPFGSKDSLAGSDVSDDARVLAPVGLSLGIGGAEQRVRLGVEYASGFAPHDSRFVDGVNEWQLRIGIERSPLGSWWRVEGGLALERYERTSHVGASGPISSHLLGASLYGSFGAAFSVSTAMRAGPYVELQLGSYEPDSGLSNVSAHGRMMLGLRIWAG